MCYALNFLRAHEYSLVDAYHNFNSIYSTLCNSEHLSLYYLFPPPASASTIRKNSKSDDDCSTRP